MTIFDLDAVEFYASISLIQERIGEILDKPISATKKEEKLLNQLYKEVNRDSSVSSSLSKSKKKRGRKNRNKINRKKKTKKNRSKK